ncbi:oxalate--CoA ligase [Dendrobium catenatum]|uniref:4-coumarate--CoA ligase n=1 Tax=Dendrobium catenatum TaxID=906689 RepID=A0A2I0VI05_9ASPA|nr:oxalate--CoA ligase [Dendrobium catenatum]PKU63049.1 4-coumarate--CoA ligase-like 10 [Dendrobium catenatum]
MAEQTLTGDLKLAARKFPSRRSLSVPGKIEITYSRLDSLIDSAASSLIAAGVVPGDVIALTFPNTVEFVIMFLAVIRSRATAAPLNSSYTQEEFEFYLSDSESKLLLTNKQGNAAAVNAAAKLGLPHATADLPDASSVVQIDGLPGTAVVTDDYPSPVSTIANETSDVALFLHTSGTTSRPKGVPLTQQNLAASVKNIRSVYRITETDSTLIVLPLFHVHGLLAGLLSSLTAGAAVALPAVGRFSASTFWTDMRAAGATWYTAVPTLHQILLDRHASASEAPYPPLRFIRSCSASLAPAVFSHLEATFGAPVLEAYAMTEASHLMCTNPLPEDGPHKPGSVGRPVGQELAILDEAGAVRPPGFPGEVCIRGPNVTKGYKNNTEVNQAAFLHGWFHTGDIGFVDDDGYLHLVGRIKELINRGGEKISPIEVDAVLLAHPGVSQAVAFGVPDDKYGEEINCAVIPREGTEIDVEEMKSYCKKNLASFKVPKKFFVTESLPKTATGKIQRRMVAEQFVAQAKATKVGA